MAVSRRSGRSRFTLVLLVLTSVTVLTLDFRGAPVIDDVRGAASTVFGPVRDAANTVTRPFRNAWNGVTGYDDLERENEQLRQRIGELEGGAAAAIDAQEQLGEIAALDDLPITAAIPSVVARVSAVSISNFDDTIELSKGSGDGLAVGMPVVTGAGLVGRVVHVTGDRARVQRITEAGFDMGVRMVTTGTVGIAHGRGIGRLLVVDVLDPKLDIPPGEPVTTTQFERSIFPADVPVGVVRAVSLDEDGRQQHLEVEPLADLSGLQYVRVLLWTPQP